MIEVSSELKDRFLLPQGQKEIKIEFPELGLTIFNENIYADTLNLKETILDSDSIEFVGCISNVFSIQIHGIDEKLKNRHIKVSISAQGVSEWIPLFDGYVDSVMTRITDSWKELTCYDALYYRAADKDVAEWYNSLHFPITLGEFRNSLFFHIGIQQEKADLFIDRITIEKKYDPKQLNALDLIKQLCQLVGCFGIMNRYGKFEYRTLQKATKKGLYPSLYIFPSDTEFPQDENFEVGENGIRVSYYKKMQYEDYMVDPIGMVEVSDDSDDIVGVYGTGGNTYVVHNNIFTYGLSNKAAIAMGIYQNVQGATFRPFASDLVGLPFAECGDLVEFRIADFRGGKPSFVTGTFYVMNRTLKGIQNIFDTYTADGEENVRVFVSDLKMKIDLVKEAEDDGTKKAIEDLDDRVKALEEGGGGGGFNVLSVASLPANPAKNTIYLIQGEVFVK